MVVVPLKRTSGTVKNLKNPDEMDMEEVGYFKSSSYGSNRMKHMEKVGLGFQIFCNTIFFKRLQFFLPAGKTVHFQERFQSYCLCY